MKRKRFNSEQIVRMLRDVERLQGEDKTIAQACQHLGISEQTYHRWKKQYGRSDVDAVKRLKALEAENARLKRLVADQALDKAILEEALKVKF